MIVSLKFSSGITAALGAALLFGISTPVAKVLLGSINLWLLAGLLYLGSGLGLTVYRLVTRAPSVRLPKHEWGWLLGAVLAGGVVAPVLLLLGLQYLPASNASLLLNAEGVLTAVLAWVVFKENVDRRIFLGMVAIVVGAMILSGGNLGGEVLPSLALLGACLGWAIDNNLTRKVSLNDATWLTAVKGLVAGSTNLLLALVLGTNLPSMTAITSALVLGFLAYGVSLSLFIISLRHLGTARTGAYFAVAPFFGALVSVVLLHEPITGQLVVAGILMALGVYLHLTEHHSHEHTHEVLEHEHEHTHDEHHQHNHTHEVLSTQPHKHWHRHDPITHSHAHYPDVHHQHSH